MALGVSYFAVVSIEIYDGRRVKLLNHSSWVIRILIITSQGRGYHTIRVHVRNLKDRLLTQAMGMIGLTVCGQLAEAVKSQFYFLLSF
jgi:hypothetical protein